MCVVYGKCNKVSRSFGLPFLGDGATGSYRNSRAPHSKCNCSRTFSASNFKMVICLCSVIQEPGNSSPDPRGRSHPRPRAGGPGLEMNSGGVPDWFPTGSYATRVCRCGRLRSGQVGVRWAKVRDGGRAGLHRGPVGTGCVFITDPAGTGSPHNREHRCVGTRRPSKDPGGLPSGHSDGGPQTRCPNRKEL